MHGRIEVDDSSTNDNFRAELQARLDEIESCDVSGAESPDDRPENKSWDSLFDECLDRLDDGDAGPLRSLANVCLDRRASDRKVSCGRLIDSCLKRSRGESENSGTAVVVQVCLDRLQSDDEVAWAVLQEFTFAQVIKKCELIIRSKISRNNPVITENGVAADVYLRLHKAMRENKSATPKTAREYFGLAARNIRWQINDLLRKPKNVQEETGVLADLAASTGVTTEVLKMDVWLKFWTAVSELPNEQREVFDLIWMNELSQYEAAKELGLKRDRVKDLWREIKITIAQECEEVMPHLGPLG